MPDLSTESLTAIAERAARAGASGLRENGAATQRKSGHNDVVTADDRASEARIVAVLAAETPGSRIHGEEGGALGGSGEPVWHVDPIDGTSNYATGLPAYCVSVGATVAGRAVAGAVYDPRRDEMFSTAPDGVLVNGHRAGQTASGPESDSILICNAPYEGAWFRDEDAAVFPQLLRAFRGVRRLGSAALALAYVAAGRASATMELRTNPWDHVAGAALVLASGGAFHALDAEDRPTDLVDAAVRYAATAPGYPWDQSVLRSILSPADERSPAS